MNKKFRDVLAVLLAVAMVLALTACGNSEGGNGKAEATPTPEFTYVASYKTLDSDESFYPSFYADTGYYSTVSEKIGERELLEDEVLEYEGQLDIYGQMLYFIGYDGSVKKLDGYTALTVESRHPEAREDSISSYISSIFEYNGGLAIIENLYENWNDAPDTVERYSDEYWGYNHYSNAYYLRTLDKDGKELTCVELSIPDSVGEDYFYLDYPCISNDGKLVAANNGNEYSIIVYNTDGTILNTIPMDNYVDRILKLADGKMYLMSWMDNITLREIDLATGNFGESISLPNQAYDPIAGDDNYDIYYNNYSSLYGYNFGDEDGTKIITWIDVDVDGNNLNNTKIDPDGTIITYSTEYDSATEEWINNIITLTKKPYDSVPHKTEITLATQGLSWDIRSAIINFNRTDPDYRIVVKDYSEYNTDDDYSAGLTKLTTEILAGNMPDILDMSGLNYKQLAQKGLLEDLYTYIDSDSEFKREDFFPNVLATAEYDGKLCATVSNFSIMTLVGSSSVVGDKMGWTYDEFNAALASMPEGCSPLSYYFTKADILQYCLGMDMDQYVDWATGKCSFDSDSFKQLLAFADTFPAEYNWDDYEYVDESELIAQGQQMLMTAYVSDFNSLLQYNHIFSGKITYVGFPSNSGTGSMIMNNSNGYAISAKSAYKDAAWQFLRMLFTKDYQLSQYNLPSNIKAYDEMEKKAMTPEYEKDADGNYILDENGEKIMISRGGYGWGNGDDYVEIYCTSEEDAATIRELVSTTTKVYNYNTDSVFEIVSEQAEPYFAGQKSADEVAKLIQSKVNIYVNEQR